jgi:hypothetical protein
MPTIAIPILRTPDLNAMNSGVARNDVPLLDNSVTFAPLPRFLRRVGCRAVDADKWHLDGKGEPQ